MESTRAKRVLFLCTHNSARSILAEGLANRLGGSRLRGFSAGSRPSGCIHPLALVILREHGCVIDDLHSKSREVFNTPDAAPMDAVITVCDDAADEICPLWPGAPARAHWGLPDPSRARGDSAAQRKAFEDTAARLIRRIRGVLALPLERLGSSMLQQELQRIHDEDLREADCA